MCRSSENGAIRESIRSKLTAHSCHLITDGEGRVFDAHLRGENEDLGLAEDVTGHRSRLHHLGLLRVAPAGDYRLGIPVGLICRAWETGGVNVFCKIKEQLRMLHETWETAQYT